MTSHEDLRIALGALALDALDPDEARDVRRHLADCSECRAEYGSLVGVRTLLDAGFVGGLVRAERERPTSRPISRAEAARSPRRRGLRGGLAVALASVTAAAVIVAAAAVLALTRQDTASTATSTATATKATDRTVSAVGPQGVKASIEFHGVAWGTSLQITMSDLPAYYHCTLLAVGKDGSVQFASSWGSGAAGGTVTVPGGVAMDPSLIDHFDVALMPGVDLEIPVPAANS